MEIFWEWSVDDVWDALTILSMYDEADRKAAKEIKDGMR